MTGRLRPIFGHVNPPNFTHSLSHRVVHRISLDSRPIIGYKDGVRQTRDTEAAADFARHLHILHVAAGKPSWDKMVKEIYAQSGRRIDLAAESIGRAHRGETDPCQANTKLLIGLCSFYECSPTELGEHAAKELDGVLVLAAHFGPPLIDTPDPDDGDGGGDQPSGQSAWTATEPATIVYLPISDTRRVSRSGQEAA